MNWDKLGDALVELLSVEIIKKQIIKLLGLSSSFPIWLAGLVADYLANKYGEPAIEYSIRKVRKAGLTLEGIAKLKLALKAKEEGKYEEYIRIIGSI